MSLDLQSHSLRQLIFNTWQDGQGFASSAPAAAASMTSVVMERLEQLLKVASYKGFLGEELKKQLGEEVDRLGIEIKRGDATLEALEEAVAQNLQQSWALRKEYKIHSKPHLLQMFGRFYLQLLL